MEKKKATMQNAFGFVKSFVSPEGEVIDVMTSKGFVQDLIGRVKRVEISALSAQLAYFFFTIILPITYLPRDIATIS
ncbi:hypothetical protein OL548_00295 [Lysinibacillus sp. MHQ-1]|nr:hypothetical protein OL548_00295 [Lysinibacillus sp. MHQ-1]